VFKLTLKSLLDRKIRLALTTFAVVLGVAFVSGAFIVADSLRATFGEVADEIAGPISVQVRGTEAFEGDINSRNRVPEELLGLVRAQPGVAEANGFIQGFPRVSVGEDFQDLIDPGQAPTLAFNYEDAVTAFEIVDGQAPVGDEVLIDVDTARTYEISLGDPISVRAPDETLIATVSGFVRFGSENGAGAAFVLLDTPTMQRVFGYEGAFAVIDVASEIGVAQDELAAAVNAVLPDGAEAVTGEEVASEFSDQFGTFISVFQTVLLAFAFVALIVSGFIINNTFSIVLGQRIKELGLLRTLGATGRQVRQSVLLEAAIVGAIASITGILAGIGFASLIKWAISQAGGGAGLPDGPLIIAARTWIVAIVVGLGITMLSAVSPARKAASIPPIAALRDDIQLSSGSTKRRTIVGLLLGVLGAVFSVIGSISSGGALAQLGPLALGAVFLFVSVAALSPMIARPVAHFIGAPVARFRGTPGQLARENAARNPRRTASTASALMVGLALVGTVLVIGTSFKKTFTSVLDTSLKADFFIEVDGGQSFIGFSPQLADDLEALPEIEVAAGFRGGDRVAAMRVEGDRKWVFGTDASALGGMIDLDLIEGSVEGFANRGLLVHSDPAGDLGLSPGDKVDAEFPIGGVIELTVVGIYDDGSILGNWVISTETYEAGFDSTFQLDLFASAVIADGVDPDVARAAADEVAAAYPEASLQDRDEFQATLEGRIDQLLVAVNALLLFAIVIAALGIVNTLMLSVFERTREIGLLRAIGMTRSQTRSMVRWEAVIVAVFGGLLGLALGVVFGLIAIAAMPDSFITETGIPIGSFIVIMVMCGIVGTVAALFPGIRAARLKVLDAISHV
jgi:putative ABC transport system permease protein